MARNTTTLWMAWRQQRDERAFEDLVRPELPALFDLSRRLGAQPDEAEDVVQHALVELAGVRSSKPARVGVGPWLMRAVRLRTLTVCRGLRRRRGHETRAAALPRRTPEAGAGDLRHVMEAALTALPERDRTVLLMRFLYDMEYAQIATALGCTARTCRVRVHRALARLRGRIGTDGREWLALLPMASVPRGFNASVATASSPAAASLAGGLLAMEVTKTVGVVVATAAVTLVTAHVAGFRLAHGDPPDVARDPGTAQMSPVSHSSEQGAAQLAVDTDVSALRKRVRELELALAARKPVPAPSAAETTSSARPDPSAALNVWLKWLAERKQGPAVGKLARQLARELELGERSVDEFVQVLSTATDESVLRGALIVLIAGGGDALGATHLESLVLELGRTEHMGRKLLLYRALTAESHRIESRESLRALIRAESNPDVLVRVIPMLDRRGLLYDKSWLERLALHAEHAEVRTAAMGAYVRRGDVSFRSLLEQATEGEPGTARRWAAGFLQRLTSGPISIKPRTDVPEMIERMRTLYRNLQELEQRRSLIERAVYATMDEPATREFLESLLELETDPQLRALIQRRMKLRDLYR